MISKKQKVLVLQEVIGELRRRYDLINQMYDAARFKTLTFIGAGFALLSYLYSSSVEGDLFMPNETYGKIFYAVAIYLIVGTMIELLSSVKGSRWEFTCHENKMKDVENKEDHLSFLRYMRDEYLRTTIANGRTYEIKHKVLNESLLKLSIGGILVVLIKIFGNQ